jgi:Flp pilus assembly CpaF family ATPase
MRMLGWRILPRGDYSLGLPALTEEEEGLVAKAQERFREATRLREASCEEEGRKLVEESLSGSAEEGGLYIGRAQQEYLGRVAFMHIYGFGFMGQLLEDDSIEEISVIGPGLPVYVYVRKQGWKSVDACFESERAIADVVNRMARTLGRRITMQNPRLDAVLPDGSRLHASLGPVSAGEMTIRRFREEPFSPRELVEEGLLGADAMAFLSVIMQCDCSVMIGGNTASGKTTTMNALFSFVPACERVLIAEQTPEIRIPHPHQLRMVANAEMGISLRDLVYDSLRMRPDRMIVGEVRRRDEAEALFEVLLAGQARGSYATFHAQSAAEALARLRSFGISDLDAIDCLVIQRRMLVYDPRTRGRKEVRRVVEIAEVRGGEAEVIYRPGCAIRPRALLQLAAGSFGLGGAGMAREIARRRKLIMGAGPSFREFFPQVQGALFGDG